jgi:hypothetical protein
LSNHEHYKELCARAAYGGASAGEIADLREHLRECGECCVLAEDFGQIVGQVMPQVIDESTRGDMSPNGKQQFYKLAKSKGIELSNPLVLHSVSKPVRIPKRALSPALVLATLGFLIFLGIIYYRKWENASELKYNDEASVPSLRMPPASSLSQGVVASGSKAGGVRSDLSEENSELKQRFRALEVERDKEMAELSQLRMSLESERREKAESSAHQAALETSNTDLEETVKNKEAQVGQVQKALDNAQSTLDSSRLALRIAEGDRRELREEIARLNGEIDEGSQVGAGKGLEGVGSGALKLIAARNLHIVDVHDTDEQGKGQKAFGRIFYVEGKELVFYAYDLADPKKLSGKKDFFVWGERLGNIQSVKSLGVLRADDLAAGRWIFTFGDPAVLSKIDSVFVTVESTKQVTKEPGGRKILYAYLGTKPNHP